MVEVIIIGSGQAGVPLATRLAGAGSQVIRVGRALIGGTCTSYGSRPTRTMVASARAAHVVRTSARLGVHLNDVRVDLPEVVARREPVVTRWREGVVRRLAAAGERHQRASVTTLNQDHDQERNWWVFVHHRVATGKSACDAGAHEWVKI
jgi:pyruvate/2-oxoglutarate dehydrogenase complex dihydrolipoamide dehydrogenase (E3) component